MKEIKLVEIEIAHSQVESVGVQALFAHELLEKLEKAHLHRGLLLAKNIALKDALADAISGLEYIRQTRGELYGVGFDRVLGKSAKALGENKGCYQVKIEELIGENDET